MWNTSCCSCKIFSSPLSKFWPDFWKHKPLYIFLNKIHQYVNLFSIKFRICISLCQKSSFWHVWYITILTWIESSLNDTRTWYNDDVWFVDWQHIYYVWRTCFITINRNSNVIKLCFLSCSFMHIGASYEEWEESSI